MFLTDWPLHLFPEVTLVTICPLFFFSRKCRVNLDMTFPTVVAMAHIVVRLSYLFNRFFSTYLLPPASNTVFVIYLWIFTHSTHLFHTSDQSTCRSQAPSF